MNKFKKYAVAASAGAMLSVGVGVSGVQAQNVPVSRTDTARIVDSVMSPVENDPVTSPLIKEAVRDAQQGNFKDARGLMWSVASISKSNGNNQEYSRSMTVYKFLNNVISVENGQHSKAVVQDNVQEAPVKTAQQQYQDQLAAQQAAAQQQAYEQQQAYAQKQAYYDQQMAYQQQIAAQQAYVNQQAAAYQSAQWQYQQQVQAQQYAIQQQYMQQQEVMNYVNTGLNILWVVNHR